MGVLDRESHLFRLKLFTLSQFVIALRVRLKLNYLSVSDTVLSTTPYTGEAVLLQIKEEL